MRRTRNIILVVAFLAVLVTPALASIFRLNPFNAIDEKRVLAKKPDMALLMRGGLQKVPAMAQAWDKYFSENFGLRKLLIGTYRLVTFHVLHISPNPAVVVGQSDGVRRWLYFNASVSGDGVGLESVQGKKPYTPAQLAAIAARLRQITATVRASGAALVIAVAPDKQSVYPQYLPPSQQPKAGAVSRLDQFWAMAATLPDVPLVDLRAPLMPLRDTEQLFYPSDTHWNPRAGFLAYQAIARAISAQDPARTVEPLTNVQWVIAPPHVGDLTVLMGLPAMGGDREFLPIPATMQPTGPKRGKLLIIGDSFFHLVAPFIEPNFEKVSKQYVTRGTRDAVLAPGLMDREKPDVVIVESVERYWTMD